jgi:hypothetical protein
MATQGSQRHSKTLGNNQVKIFSTLASTLEFGRARTADLCFLAAEVGKNRMLPLRQRRSKRCCAQFTWAFMGSNPENCVQPTLNECFGLLSSTKNIWQVDRRTLRLQGM